MNRSDCGSLRTPRCMKMEKTLFVVPRLYEKAPCKLTATFLFFFLVSPTRNASVALRRRVLYKSQFFFFFSKVHTHKNKNKLLVRE